MCNLIRKLLVRKKLIFNEGESPIDAPFISIEFYREKDTRPFMQSDVSTVPYRWYAKLHGVPKEDCEMIEGADVFLDTFWRYRRIKENISSNSITLRITTEWYSDARYIAHLKYSGADSEGYFYECTYEGSQRFNTALMETCTNEKAFSLWICKCLDLVYDKIPENLFIF